MFLMSMSVYTCMFMYVCIHTYTHMYVFSLFFMGLLILGSLKNIYFTL